MNTPIESLKIVNELRTMGFKVDMEMENKKIKKSLDYANKEKIPYVIIIGEDEIKNKYLKLKSMSDGNEYLINFNNLDKIKSIIN